MERKRGECLNYTTYIFFTAQSRLQPFASEMRSEEFRGNEEVCRSFTATCRAMPAALPMRTTYQTNPKIIEHQQRSLS